MSSTPYERDEGPPVDVTPLIRQVNASNPASEDLYLRARQAADIAGRGRQGRDARHGVTAPSVRHSSSTRSFCRPISSFSVDAFA